MPAWVNLWANVPPEGRPGLPKLPSSAVTVWSVGSWFVQTTLSPALMVTDDGWNEKLWMVTCTVAAARVVVVGLAAVVVVDRAVVDVGGRFVTVVLALVVDVVPDDVGALVVVEAATVVEIVGPDVDAVVFTDWLLLVVVWTLPQAAITMTARRTAAKATAAPGPGKVFADRTIFTSVNLAWETLPVISSRRFAKPNRARGLLRLLAGSATRVHPQPVQALACPE